MAAERKLSDAELERLRVLGEEGRSHRDLGESFGITSQYVGRLLRGERRATITGTDAEALQGGVLGAVETFLEDLTLPRSDAVLAAAARVVAGKLDACASADSATAAQAVPRLGAELAEIVERLRMHEPRELDFIDRLQHGVEARRLGNVAPHNEAAE